MNLIKANGGYFLNDSHAFHFTTPFSKSSILGQKITEMTALLFVHSTVLGCDSVT